MLFFFVHFFPSHFLLMNLFPCHLFFNFGLIHVYRCVRVNPSTIHKRRQKKLNDINAYNHYHAVSTTASQSTQYTCMYPVAVKGCLLFAEMQLLEALEAAIGRLVEKAGQTHKLGHESFTLLLKVLPPAISL